MCIATQRTHICNRITHYRDQAVWHLDTSQSHCAKAVRHPSQQFPPIDLGPSALLPCLQCHQWLRWLACRPLGRFARPRPAHMHVCMCVCMFSEHAYVCVCSCGYMHCAAHKQVRAWYIIKMRNKQYRTCMCTIHRTYICTIHRTCICTIHRTCICTIHHRTWQMSGVSRVNVLIYRYKH
jgi:hypothetical protein